LGHLLPIQPGWSASCSKDCTIAHHCTAICSSQDVADLVLGTSLHDLSAEAGQIAASTNLGHLQGMLAYCVSNWQET